MSTKNKTYGNILTVTKCCECKKIFKVPLTPDVTKAFENPNSEVHLMCYDCVKAKMKNRPI